MLTFFQKHHLYLLLVFYSCGHNNSTDNKRDDQQTMDSRLAAYHESIVTDPAATRLLLREQQQRSTDSLDYYNLQSFISLSYFYENKPDSACIVGESVIAFLKRSNQTSKQAKDLEASQYNRLGAFYWWMDKKDSSITCHLNAIAAAKEGGGNALPNIYINLADNYYLLGDFPNATLCLRQALRAIDSLKLKDKHTHVVNTSLGRIYTDLGNFPLADHYFSMVENILDSIPPYDQYLFTNSRSNYYYSRKEYSKALDWYYKAYALIRSFGLPEQQAGMESNIGGVYLKMNQTDSAQHYFDKAAEVYLAPETSSSSAYYFNGRYASLYLQQNNLKAAEQLLAKPYDLSQMTPMYINFHNEWLEELYRKKGDYRKAYEYRLQVNAYNDSVLNITAQNNIAEIDSRYKQDTIVLKRDALIAQKEQKVSQFRSISILTVALLLLTIAGGVTTALLVRRKRDLRNARQMETITKLRMENVRNRISPHFVFNVLNAVVPSLRQHEELSLPLHLLTQSIRENLLLSEKIAIRLEEEVEIVKNYVLLRKSIDADTPTIAWRIDPEVNMNTLVPSMVIQIPVENAIKYAFESYDENNLLSVDITTKEDRLSIVIEDNGIGFDPGVQAQHSKGTGNGLRILFKTFELLNANNRQKLKFDIRNMTDPSTGRHGTSISIEVPYNYQYDL